MKYLWKKSYLCRMNLFLIFIGSISLLLGILGIFLPLLPTTPFLLLSAAAWVKASPRLYQWLISHRLFGEYIRNFREYRAIPLRVKICSVSSCGTTRSSRRSMRAVRR